MLLSSALLSLSPLLPLLLVPPPRRCVNPGTGCRLRFDFGVPGGFVELDGPSGHFGYNHFKKMPDDAAPLRDLLKEEWALEQGLSVARVLSRDVWLDAPGWRQHVAQAVEAFAAGGPARIVVPEDAIEYRDTVYAELRAAKRRRLADESERAQCIGESMRRQAVPPMSK